MNKIITIILMYFTLSTFSYAHEEHLSKQYSDCMDKSNGTTYSMIACINTETKHQDYKLNKAYKSVMKKLKPSRKKQLRNAQRLWIKYRDINCDFYADPDGGTMHKLASNECFMSTTADRRNELESFIDIFYLE